jgi:hypothetical protein
VYRGRDVENYLIFALVTHLLYVLDINDAFFCTSLEMCCKFGYNVILPFEYLRLEPG